MSERHRSSAHPPSRDAARPIASRRAPTPYLRQVDPHDPRGATVERGTLGSAYVEAGSIDAAVAAAERSGGLVWIGAVDATPDELRRILLAVDASAGAAPFPRAPASVVDGVTHLLLPAGAPGPAAELELVATSSALIVVARGLDPSRQPPALRRLLLRDLAAGPAPSTAVLVERLVSEVLRWYGQSLDGLELELEQVEALLSEPGRRPPLSRLDALARPLHGLAPALRPLARELELGPRTRAEAAHLETRVEALDRRLAATLQTWHVLAQEDRNDLLAAEVAAARRTTGIAILVAFALAAWVLVQGVGGAGAGLGAALAAAAVISALALRRGRP